MKFIKQTIAPIFTSMFILLLLSTSPAVAQEKQTITAFADVTVSDGLTYSVTTSYLDNERLIFHRIYPERKITMGRGGLYLWQYDGETEKLLNLKMGDFVTGHQFHAQIVYPERFYSDTSTLKSSEDTVCKCRIETIVDGTKITTKRFRQTDNRLVSQLTNYNGEFSVLLTYKDWRKVGNITLPYHIEIDDGARTFVYNFNKVEIDGPDIHSNLLTPYSNLSDEQKLMRHHRNMIDAHIASDESLMADQWGDEITFIYNGKIDVVKKSDARANMQKSLKARSHNKYIDLKTPVITLSDDKTLGWVTVRVRAEGNRLDTAGNSTAPLAFTSAWVSLYKKIEGHWKMVGNVSNFEAVKPD